MHFHDGGLLRKLELRISIKFSINKKVILTSPKFGSLEFFSLLRCSSGGGTSEERAHQNVKPSKKPSYRRCQGAFNL